MQGQSEASKEDNDSSDKNMTRRKRRVKRMKTVIVAIVLILLILPTLICIFLSFKVGKLEQRMNDLLSRQNGKIEYTKEDTLSDTAKKTGKSFHTVITAVHMTPGRAYFSRNKQFPDALAYQSDRNKERIPNVNYHGNRDSSIIVNKNNTAESISDSFSITDQKELKKAKQAEKDQKDVKVSQNKKKTSKKKLQKDDNGADVFVKEEAARNNVKGKEKSPDMKTSDIKITSASVGAYDGKQVYLTFDDGPGKYTNTILDILAKYKVKATFFVIGKSDKESKRLYKRIVEEGHTLGMHSYSHKYEQIYNSVEDFEKDFTKLRNLLYDTTGYMPTIYRFPGGSANLVNKNGMDDFIRFLKKNSVLYYDWNVVNGDATGIEYTKEQLIDNVLKDVAWKKRSIVLMHDSDSKKSTVDSLTELLEDLISGGAEILPLDATVEPIQQIKAEQVK